MHLILMVYACLISCSLINKSKCHSLAYFNLRWTCVVILHKIVHVYDQSFKVGIVGHIVSTLDVGFRTNMVLPIQKRSSMFNEVYIVNHFCDILDHSCKWLVFKYSYRCKGPKNAFGFTLKYE